MVAWAGGNVLAAVSYILSAVLFPTYSHACCSTSSAPILAVRCNVTRRSENCKGPEFRYPAIDEQKEAAINSVAAGRYSLRQFCLTLLSSFIAAEVVPL